MIFRLVEFVTYVQGSLYHYVHIHYVTVCRLEIWHSAALFINSSCCLSGVG